MSLEEEIATAAKKVVKDGYDMSIGELISLYKDKELIINPNYQRLFRWDDSQKTKFIESLLLGIPIPPIFVFTTEGRKWELVDGLQRVSTILEFVGILQTDSTLALSSTLSGTKLLPSLAGKKWQDTDENSADGLSEEQRLDIKRVRLRVEILKKESDPLAKYELFQRLNSGGASLSEQEIRSCTIVMINEGFFSWLQGLLADTPEYNTTIIQTDYSEQRQKPLELLIRYLAYRHHPYHPNWDVHEYLDYAAIELATNVPFSMEDEAKTFSDTFKVIHETVGVDAFRKWDGTRFTGKFLLAAFDVVAYGLSNYIEGISSMTAADQKTFIEARIKSLWDNDTFKNYSRAGVRGTTRLTNLLPLAKDYFRP